MCYLVGPKNCAHGNKLTQNVTPITPMLHVDFSQDEVKAKWTKLFIPELSSQVSRPLC